MQLLFNILLTLLAIAAGVLNLMAYSKYANHQPVMGIFNRMAIAAGRRNQKTYWIFVILLAVIQFWYLAGMLAIAFVFAAWAHWRLVKRVQAPKLEAG